MPRSKKPTKRSRRWVYRIHTYERLHVGRMTTEASHDYLEVDLPFPPSPGMTIVAGDGTYFVESVVIDTNISSVLIHARKI
jgi:hypothetical protein